MGNYTWSFPFLPNLISSAVEIGSRDLLDSLEISKKFDCDVIAFEPDPRNFRLCKDSLRRSGSDRISLRAEALNDEDGPVHFFAANPEVTSNFGISSLLPLHSVEAETSALDELQEAMTVIGSRWDSLGLSPPEVVFMDVQGAELRALQGFGSELDHVHAIICECEVVSSYSSGVGFFELYRFLSSKGFRLRATNNWGLGLFRTLRGILWWRILHVLRARSLSGWRTHQGIFDAVFIRPGGINLRKFLKLGT